MAVARILVVPIAGVFLLSEVASIGNTKRITNHGRFNDETSNKLTQIINDGVAPLPKKPMRKFTTDSGLVLSVPIESNHIWGAPLLSTPHPTASLRLRKDGDISAGFEQSGPWIPYGYPQYNSAYNVYVNQKLRERYHLHR